VVPVQFLDPDRDNAFFRVLGVFQVFREDLQQLFHGLENLEFFHGLFLLLSFLLVLRLLLRRGAPLRLLVRRILGIRALAGLDFLHFGLLGRLFVKDRNLDLDVHPIVLTLLLNLGDHLPLAAVQICAVEPEELDLILHLELVFLRQSPGGFLRVYDLLLEGFLEN